MIVPGGGISLDGTRWVSCRPGFFLPVRVLSRLFRRLFLEKLARRPSRRPPAVLRQSRRARPTRKPSPPIWRRYAKPNGWSTARRRSADPQAVLAYLSRYTHRVAISNRRLITFDDNGVTFKWKDYRVDGRERYKTMTLDDLRVHPPLPDPRAAPGLPPHPPLRPVRQRLPAPTTSRAPVSCSPTATHPNRASDAATDEPTSRSTLSHPCPCCGGRMIIIETFERGCHPTISADAPPTRDQDRHLMTTMPKSQRRKAARRSRWSQTGHGGARSNRPRRPPSPCRSPPLDPGRHLNAPPSIPTQVSDRRNRSPRPHLKSPQAALKSP